MEKELQQLTEDERPKDREAGKTAITRTEARIVKLQEEQVAELEKMYGMEAQDYLDEMEHRYYSRLHEPAVLDAEKHMEVSYPIASASTLECDSIGYLVHPETLKPRRRSTTAMGRSVYSPQARTAPRYATLVPAVGPPAATTGFDAG